MFKIAIPAAFILAVGGLAGSNGMSKLQGWLSGPQPYSLTVEQLVYKDGMFGQQMGVTGIKALPGDWSAEIDRDGKTLCRGAGHGLYDQDEYKQVKFFTPNEWTGAICPKLKSGDIGRAVWTYTNVNGLRVHVSGEVRVP